MKWMIHLASEQTPLQFQNATFAAFRLVGMSFDAEREQVTALAPFREESKRNREDICGVGDEGGEVDVCGVQADLVEGDTHGRCRRH